MLRDLLHAGDELTVGHDRTSSFSQPNLSAISELVVVSFEVCMCSPSNGRRPSRRTGSDVGAHESVRSYFGDVSGSELGATLERCALPATFNYGVTIDKTSAAQDPQKGHIEHTSGKHIDD